MSVPVASTPATLLVSVQTMLDPSLATVREDIQGTACGVQVKLLSFLVLFWYYFLVLSFRVGRSTTCWESKPSLVSYHFSFAILDCPFDSVLS